MLCSGPWTAAAMIVVFWKILLSPRRSSWQRSHLVLGDLPDLGPFSPIARFRWSASSRKRSAGSNYLWMMEVALLNWDLKRHFSVIFPRFLPPDKPELGPQTGFFQLPARFVLWGGLWDLTKTALSLSKSCPINWKHLRWTPAQLENDQWEQDAPELTFERYGEEGINLELEEHKWTENHSHLHFL